MLGNQCLYDFVAALDLNWQPTSEQAPTPLAAGEIHLWALDLATVSASRMEQWLQHAEQMRGKRIINDEKRKLYLGGRFGLRFLLSRYTGIDNTFLAFGYGNRGKPVLQNTPIHFNYTLSSDKVLYAFSLEHQLGVDMEKLPRSMKAESMAARKLTDPERTAWQSLPEALRHDAMLCCWTRKEAYGKAIGVGIRYQINQVNLFDSLNSPYFGTTLAGLFTDTDSTGMPETLEGAQLTMPFPAVASLMYQMHNTDTPRPKIMAHQLKL